MEEERASFGRSEGKVVCAKGTTEVKDPRQKGLRIFGNTHASEIGAFTAQFPTGHKVSIQQRVIK